MQCQESFWYFMPFFDTWAEKLFNLGSFFNMFWHSEEQQFLKEFDYVRNKQSSIPICLCISCVRRGHWLLFKTCAAYEKCVSRANTNTILKGNKMYFVFTAEETLQMPIARKYYYPPITPILTQLSIVSLRKKYFPNTWINCKRVRRTFRLTEDLYIPARPW